MAMPQFMPAAWKDSEVSLTFWLALGRAPTYTGVGKQREEADYRRKGLVEECDGTVRKLASPLCSSSADSY